MPPSGRPEPAAAAPRRAAVVGVSWGAASARRYRRIHSARLPIGFSSTEGTCALTAAAASASPYPYSWSGTVVAPAAGRAVLMIRLITLAASIDGCAARTRAAMPATIGAAAARAAPCDEPSVGGDAEQLLARRGHADDDALRGCLDARLPRRVDAGDGEHARDRRGRPDRGGAAPPVARGDHDDDVVLEGVEERVVPALVPVQRVRGQRQVDDVGAVVDGPDDRLGDLLAEADGRRCAEAHRDRQQIGLGRDADHAAADAVAARRREGGHPAAVAAVDRADGRPAVGGADARDIRPVDDRALELDRAPSRCRCRSRRCARRRRAWSARPGGCRRSPASTPPCGRGRWGPRERAAAVRRRSARPSSPRRARRVRPGRPASSVRPGFGALAALGRPRAATEGGVADRVDAGARGERVARQRVQALDARRHPAGGDPLDLGHVAVSPIGRARRPHEHAHRPRAVRRQPRAPR